MLGVPLKLLSSFVVRERRNASEIRVTAGIYKAANSSFLTFTVEGQYALMAEYNSSFSEIDVPPAPIRLNRTSMSEISEFSDSVSSSRTFAVKRFVLIV